MTRPARRFLTGLVLLFVAPAAWLLFQQGVGAASYLNCDAAGLPWGALAGLAAILACAAVALRCWRLRTEGSEARQFLMVIGAGSAAIFATAALVMTVAIVVVPTCAR